MIRSMTAFARKQEHGALGELTWEIRSVNHRFLEAVVRLPEELRGIEPTVRERVTARLRRGKVECNLRFKVAPGTTGELQLNDHLVEQILGAADKMAHKLHSSHNPSIMDILRWPGVLESGEQDRLVHTSAREDSVRADKVGWGSSLADFWSRRRPGLRYALLLIGTPSSIDLPRRTPMAITAAARRRLLILLQVPLVLALAAAAHSVFWPSLVAAMPLTAKHQLERAWRLAADIPFAQVQTETFTVLAACQWFNVLNCQSATQSVFSNRLIRNKWLIGGLLIGILLQFSVIYSETMNALFHTVPIPPADFLPIIAAASLVLWFEEIRKLITRQLSKAQSS